MGDSSLEFNTTIARSPTGLNAAAIRFARMMSNGALSTASHLGYYYDEDGLLKVTGVYLNDNGAFASITGLENTWTYTENSTLTAFNIGGVMLVREQVSIKPEPTPVAVMGGFGVLGALSLCWGARRRSAT